MSQQKRPFENIDTAKLKAYGDILENIIVSGNQIKNTANEMIARNAGGNEKKLESLKNQFNPVILPILSQIEENSVIFEKIQKELDTRMLKDLGVSKGIRRMQTHIYKFEEFLEKMADSEAAQRNIEMSKVNIITEEDIRPKPIFKLNT